MYSPVLYLRSSSAIKVPSKYEATRGKKRSTRYIALTEERRIDWLPRRFLPRDESFRFSPVRPNIYNRKLGRKESQLEREGNNRTRSINFLGLKVFQMNGRADLVFPRYGVDGRSPTPTRPRSVPFRFPLIPLRQAN